MFNLIEQPPTTYQIEDRIYELNMSFDNIIRISEIQQDNSLSDIQQLLEGARLLFLDLDTTIKIKTVIEDFIQIYTEFVMTKEEEYVEYDLLGNPIVVKNEEDDEDDEFNYSGVSKEYCLMRDAQYIYPSFVMDYGIDLHKEIGKMHWWTFKSLLNGLSDNTIFKRVLHIRQQPYPKDSKARNELEKAKRQVALPRRKTNK